VVDFGTSVVEPLGSATRELVMYDIQFKNMLQVEVYFIM
jgi:hypothetical protein